MAKNLLFLTGAPAAESLEWDEIGLAVDFQSTLRRFMGDDKDKSAKLDLAIASIPLAKWRDVPLKQKQETAATTKPSPKEAAQFRSFQDGGEDEHLNFLEYSLAVLQNLDSSQIGPSDDNIDDTVLEESTYVTAGSLSTVTSSETHFQTSSGSVASYTSGNLEQQVVNFSGQVTDLQRIPNARHLRAIHPQTMTVNILASVIAVQPARTVRLRKRQGEMDIIEVLLGDETKAGFTTTFWLVPVESQAGRPPASNARQNGLREMLEHLRLGDVLLLTHIALAEFNSNVFGQSLSRRTTRNNTTVTVLADGVSGLSAPLLAKLKRVKHWAGNFVGQGTKHALSQSRVEGTGDRQLARPVLPPDTQYE